jgi:hypothetical protein
MHGDMAGFYEVRVDGPGRRHYRAFCVLERDGASVGLGGPSIVLIAGMTKEFRTTFSRRDYGRSAISGPSTVPGRRGAWPVKPVRGPGGPHAAAAPSGAHLRPFDPNSRFAALKLPRKVEQALVAAE